MESRTLQLHFSRLIVSTKAHPLHIPTRYVHLTARYTTQPAMNISNLTHRCTPPVARIGYV